MVQSRSAGWSAVFSSATASPDSGRFSEVYKLISCVVIILCNFICFVYKVRLLASEENNNYIELIANCLLYNLHFQHANSACKWMRGPPPAILTAVSYNVDFVATNKIYIYIPPDLSVVVKLICRCNMACNSLSSSSSEASIDFQLIFEFSNWLFLSCLVSSIIDCRCNRVRAF